MLVEVEWCIGRVLLVFFFFKQKTAYEIVSRDWSSDVCSSDLIIHVGAKYLICGLNN